MGAENYSTSSAREMQAINDAFRAGRVNLVHPDPGPAAVRFITHALRSTVAQCPDCSGTGSVEGDLVDDNGEVIECNTDVRCDRCDGCGEVDLNDPDAQ